MVVLGMVLIGKDRGEETSGVIRYVREWWKQSDALGKDTALLK